MTTGKKRKYPTSSHGDEGNTKKLSSSRSKSKASPSVSNDQNASQTANPKDSFDGISTATSNPLRPTSNPYDDIKHAIVQNDGSRQNLIRLIGLKSLFAKQLPKMPKEYIARLVFDRRHKSLALLSTDPRKKNSDEEIIGGICYRSYPEMRFAEIAFCAVSASQQVKGYGTKLMNLFKRHAVTEGVEYFITYADNYAIGYFKKQGFTKVSLLIRYLLRSRRYGRTNDIRRYHSSFRLLFAFPINLE